MTDAELAEHERREAEAALRRQRQERQAKWLALADGRGQRYRECTLHNFRCTVERQREVVNDLIAYCRDMPARVREGGGLLLYGPKGTGKDHLMAACMRAAITTYGLSVRWENGQDLFGQIRDRIDQEQSEASLVRSLVYPQVLAISDPLPVFGDLSQHQANMLFRVIDGRYSARRPTWVTMNIQGPAEFEVRIGAQIADRLRDGAVSLPCNWASYRSAK